MTDTLTRVAKRIRAEGGRAFLVGGSVRDQFFGKTPKDFDVEVFGLSESELLEVLAEFGTPDTVGRSFGVVKLTVDGEDFDFSLPRRDSKSGHGHTGFTVTVDADMTLAEAQARRDFTMNALSQDVLTGEVFDFFGGQSDTETRTLRATSEHFSDDPLRVLRGMQFCARFELTATDETVEMSRQVLSEADTLSLERVWGEWHKLAVKSVAPSFGLRFLEQVGWLEPELAAMVGCEQSPVWHPEGDVWEHTLRAVDHAAGMDEEVFFAVLLHDAGKPTTTSDDFSAHGHAEVGAEVAREFMARVGAPADLTERVVALVREHMWRGPASARSVRRLARRVAPSSVEALARVMECDQAARGAVADVAAMLDLARQEQCESEVQAPLVMGRHLLAVGWSPGRHVGEALRAAFDAQTDGEFDSVEAGVEWVQAHF